MNIPLASDAARQAQAFTDPLHLYTPKDVPISSTGTSSNPTSFYGFPDRSIPRRDSSGQFTEPPKPNGAPTPIPATVQIGPFAFKIIASAREIRTRENHSGDQLNGQIEFEGCTIAMEPTMCRDHQASTLLHEVIHGIWWNAGHNEDSKKMTNEDIIKFLAPALLDVLRRNPALVAFLVEAHIT